tara:strand:+ start:37 stop:468 length:432 start_codon:yes stop_codon:yes gene_type:complete
MEWRKIEGYENYEVSSSGDVRHGDYMMAKIDNGNGYKYVHLPKKMTSIHRLVALAFILPIEGKTEVDHINGIRHDNRAENLKWADRSEQTINKMYPVGRTRERNICFHKGCYEVVIVRNQKRVFYKCCKTLPEAIEARNNYLQ